MSAPESNIVALPNSFVPSPEPVQDIIDLLEEVLVKARDGRVVGIGMVVVEREPVAFELIYTAQQGSRHSLAAGVAALNTKISAQLAGIIE